MLRIGSRLHVRIMNTVRVCVSHDIIFTTSVHNIANHNNILYSHDTPRLYVRNVRIDSLQVVTKVISESVPKFLRSVYLNRFPSFVYSNIHGRL